MLDILAVEPDTRMLDGILGQTIAKFHEKGIYQIVFPTLKSNNSINKALRRSGFISLDSILAKFRRRCLRLLLAIALDNSLDPKIVLDPKNWYFTNIFTEGVQFDNEITNS